MRLPEWPITKGKQGQSKMPDGSVRRFTVEGEIRRAQSTEPETKVLYLQRLRFDDGHDELRLGYYIIGKKPRMAGRWVWGQFAPIMPVEDFKAIVTEAQQRGWI